MVSGHVNAIAQYISLLSVLVLSKLIRMYIQNCLIDHLEKHYTFSLLLIADGNSLKAIKITNPAIDATDQWHRQLDWAYESAVCPLIIARVLIQFPHKPVWKKIHLQMSTNVAEKKKM